jgi:diaminohydroxyphosphoribosylaminopyrimidine deaminase/5-amino-6-(5-phosphoribosylamino)uracil reductase
VDEVRVFIAPLVIGGRGARAPFEGEGSASVSDAFEASAVDVSMVDEDVLIQARLREW